MMPGIGASRSERPRHRRHAALLDVQGLHLTRGGRDVLSGVTLRVGPEEIHSLLGPNGSGKSTLAYVLVGCPDYVPDGGRIRFAGRDLSGLSMTERARLGLTLGWQEPARFEGLTVRAYVGVGVGVGGRGADPGRVVESLERVGLSPREYLSRPVDRALSGGERKRIELAAVYAMRPKLAILDEPDSGVDVLSLDEVADVVRRMARTGAAALLITHRDEMAGVADAASLMDRGTVVCTGTPQQVRARYRAQARQHEQTLATGGSSSSRQVGKGTPWNEREQV